MQFLVLCLNTDFHLVHYCTRSSVSCEVMKDTEEPLRSCSTILFRELQETSNQPSLAAISSGWELITVQSKETPSGCRKRKECKIQQRLQRLHSFLNVIGMEVPLEGKDGNQEFLQGNVPCIAFFKIRSRAFMWLC